MKLFWRNLFYLWRFYTLSPNEYRECMGKVFVSNNLMGLWQVNAIVVILCTCFSFFPIVIEKNLFKAGIYFIITAVALLLMLISRYKYKQYKQNKQSTHLYIGGLIILYFINVMFFGIYVGVISNPVEIAGTFMVFLIVALVLFNLSPVFNLCLTLTATAAFIITTVSTKIPIYWTYDIANVLLATLLSLGFGWQINRYRLSAISTIRRTEAIISNFSGMVYQRRFHDSDWHFTFVSDGSKDLFGYTPEETIANINTFIDMVHPEDREETEQHIAEFLSPDSSVNTITYRIILRDGTIKWIMERARIMERASNGTPLLIEGYCSDITEQKRLEEAEHEQQRMKSRIEKIISNLPGMVYQHLYEFPECTILYVSDGSKEFVGYTPEELVGGPNKFMAMVHPDDLEGMGTKYSDAIEAGLTYEQTYRIIMPDGSIKWIMDRCTVLEKNPDGTPASVEGYMFDVTEQKKLEVAELSELMLDTTPLCVQLWDRNFNTIDCNEAAVKLYGFKSKREYVENFINYCSPEYQPDGQRSNEKAAILVNKAFEGEHCVFDWMHQMPDGTPLPAEVTLVRVKYKDDYLVVGYTRDLRDVLRLEAEAEKIYYDALTGIYNRRFFDENLERNIKTISRSGNTLSLMMIDIDCFKKYNDTYGHSEGDNCLRIVAETLFWGIKRADDFIARYGGEEFAVVLPNTDEHGACLLAENLLQSIRDRNILHEKNKAADCITVSIGVITGKPEYTQDPNDYIKRADEMLYISKQNGRNRYTFDYL